jgi:hypothetical protein
MNQGRAKTRRYHLCCVLQNLITETIKTMTRTTTRKIPTPTPPCGISKRMSPTPNGHHSPGKTPRAKGRVIDILSNQIIPPTEPPAKLASKWLARTRRILFHHRMLLFAMTSFNLLANMVCCEASQLLALQGCPFSPASLQTSHVFRVLRTSV